MSAELLTSVFTTASSCNCRLTLTLPGSVMSPVTAFCVARTLSTSMLISLLVVVPGAPSSTVLFASLALANSNVVVTGAPSNPPVVSP